MATARAVGGIVIGLGLSACLTDLSYDRPPGVAGVWVAPNDVRHAINEAYPRIRGCYEQLLQRDPNARGTIGTKFVIAEDGHVETAVVSDGTLTDAETTACVVDVFSSLSFPRPQNNGKIVVHFPLEFRPEWVWAQAAAEGFRYVPACRDPGLIRAVVATRRHDFADCAKQLYRRHKWDFKAVNVRFTISPGGTVSFAAPVNVGGLDDERTHQCVANAFWSMEFPACGEDETSARYEVKLHASPDCPRDTCIDSPD